MAWHSTCIWEYQSQDSKSGLWTLFPPTPMPSLVPGPGLGLSGGSAPFSELKHFTDRNQRTELDSGGRSVGRARCPLGTRRGGLGPACSPHADFQPVGDIRTVSTPNSWHRRGTHWHGRRPAPGPKPDLPLLWAPLSQILNLPPLLHPLPLQNGHNRDLFFLLRAVGGWKEVSNAKGQPGAQDAANRESCDYFQKRCNNALTGFF